MKASLAILSTLLAIASAAPSLQITKREAEPHDLALKRDAEPTLIDTATLEKRVDKVQFTTFRDTGCKSMSAGLGAQDGICYDLGRPTSLTVDYLAPGCRMVVFDPAGCGGASATFTVADRTCWQTANRNSFQVYCEPVV